MSAAGPPFLYVFCPTVLWMQYETAVLRTTLTFLIPWSYEALRTADERPEYVL
jgi:hypothetical protein